MTAWRFWVRGELTSEVPVEVPRLASWMAKTHPDQVRLTTYLKDLIDRLSPLPADPRPLFLHMEIGVSDAKRLLTHNDLENYLTPLFGVRWLDPSRFVFVSATKHVGVASRIEIGYANLPSLERVIAQEYIVIDPGKTPLQKAQLLNEIEYREAQEQYGEDFVAGMGAEAIKKLLSEIDLNKLNKELEKAMGATKSKQIRQETGETPQARSRLPKFARTPRVDDPRGASGNSPGFASVGSLGRRPIRDIRPKRSLSSRHQSQQPAQESAYA